MSDDTNEPATPPARMPTDPKPRRRWLRFSLRTLFVVVTVGCFLAQAIVIRQQQARITSLENNLKLERAKVGVVELSLRSWRPPINVSVPIGNTSVLTWNGRGRRINAQGLPYPQLHRYWLRFSVKRVMIVTS